MVKFCYNLVVYIAYHKSTSFSKYTSLL
jgi:hypothetical protein